MSEKEMLNALTRRLATADLPDGSIDGLAKMASSMRHKAIGIDICKYGICLDLLIDGGIEALDLKEVVQLAPGKIRDIDIFPWGIVNPDLWRVRIGQEF